MSIYQQLSGILERISSNGIPPDKYPSLESENALQNKVITAELNRIDEDIEALSSLRGDLTKAGLVQLTDASDVTDTAGKALAATQNNPAISGTLANKIKQLEDVNSKIKVVRKIDPVLIRPGFSQINSVDAVRLFLLNNGLRVITGVLVLNNVDQHKNAGHDILVGFPQEYTYVFSDQQFWTGHVICAENGVACPIRIGNDLKVFLWGGNIYTNWITGNYVLSVIC